MNAERFVEIALAISAAAMLGQSILVYLTVRQMRRFELLRDLSSNFTETGSEASGSINSVEVRSTIFRSE
ncbi:hypothetical protein sphantq_02965 [Sphingobium sp. AntQ-1]|uniref:hypothetical protein n=1 Tax=Sphingobium sp. AntQ-1 TaxID=2930091 RepID=UPI00234E43C9|nr:hypothetical protein [Sphingobium sp. AntQ-1]WCP14519.1 hypothetical protein sphantq_02965 [Sphingobium sp. AntQ-1]